MQNVSQICKGIVRLINIKRALTEIPSVNRYVGFALVEAGTLDKPK